MNGMRDVDPDNLILGAVILILGAMVISAVFYYHAILPQNMAEKGQCYQIVGHDASGAPHWDYAPCGPKPAERP